MSTVNCHRVSLGNSREATENPQLLPTAAKCVCIIINIKLLLSYAYVTEQFVTTNDIVANH
jgi:hypothetical protein